MLSHKKSQIETYLEPLAGLLSKVNPNVLTLIGSIPPLLFFVFVIYKMYFLAFIALMGSAVDLLDGMVARKYNKVTNFGGFFDSIIDRLGDFLYITAFSFSGIVRWEIVAPLLLFSFMTSYIRSRAGLAAKSHMEFAIGLIERPERLLFIFLSLLLYIIFPEVILSGLNIAESAFLLLTILSFVTVIQRTIHAYKKL
jgi:phosphatidylglycerophosphate synthase